MKNDKTPSTTAVIFSFVSIALVWCFAVNCAIAAALMWVAEWMVTDLQILSVINVIVGGFVLMVLRSFL